LVRERGFEGRVVKVVGKAGSNKEFQFATDLLASFDFSGPLDNNSYPSVSPAQQKKFQADFVNQLKMVQEQLAAYKWLAPDAVLPPRVTSGPCQPPSDFHVFVSENYDLSRSLVPTWQGQRGWMEFPAHRVVVNGAAIAHELVHVLFPNGNRMLAEGLATYLQYKLLPKVAVSPNYGDALELVVEDFLTTTFKDDPAGALWAIDMEGLEGISTPDYLFVRVGTRPFIGGHPGRDAAPDPQQGKFTYSVAGSFVGFLLENPIEEDNLLTEANFGALYLSTPLRPLERDSGDPDRWEKHYQGKDRQGKKISYSFKELSLLWKTYMHFLLFSAAKPEIPIPDEYLEMPLVSDLYNKLKGMAAKASAGGSAAKRK
jgi:hypothetical protein